MREELLETILHSYKSLREEITKLRNEISHTQKDLETIKNLLKEKPCKSNRRDELKTPTDLSITTLPNIKPPNTTSLAITKPNTLIYNQYTPIQNLPLLNKTFEELELRINNKAFLNNKETI